ncbi:conserved hypothetical protein, membrane, partial [human gut metagenome]
EDKLTEFNGLEVFAIFYNNLRATLISVVFGVMPFFFLPVFALVENAAILGIVAANYAVSDLGLPMFFAGILPHGVFELTAVLFTYALGFLSVQGADAEDRRTDAKARFGYFHRRASVLCLDRAAADFDRRADRDVCYAVYYEPVHGAGMYFTREYAAIVLENQRFMFTYHSGLVATHPYSSR